MLSSLFISLNSTRINMTIPHLMRRSQLEERLGLTCSSIYKMMDDGEFPRPMKIGRRAVGWRADEIAQWLEWQQEATSDEWCLNTPPLSPISGGSCHSAPSHRERDDAYRNVVAQLAPRWRVIICRDGIQWILQRKEASHGGPWRGVSYNTNRDGLLRACWSLEALPSNGLEALEVFPEFISEYHQK